MSPGLDCGLFGLFFVFIVRYREVTSLFFLTSKLLKSDLCSIHRS